MICSIYILRFYH